jgi:hypothetical protein
MPRDIPKNLEYFLKNALEDMDDGYEYASELNRILNSDTCQLLLKPFEIDKLRLYSDKIKHFGELNFYTEKRIRETESEFFGVNGILGFLNISAENKSKAFDDLFTF